MDKCPINRLKMRHFRIFPRPEEVEVALLGPPLIGRNNYEQ